MLGVYMVDVAYLGTYGKKEEAMVKYEKARNITLYITGEFIEKLRLSTQLLIHADKSEAENYWTIMLVVFQQEKALDDLIRNGIIFPE